MCAFEEEINLKKTTTKKHVIKVLLVNRAIRR
jgi:hypothetical protein